MIKSKIRTVCLSVVFAAGCVSTAEVSTQAKNPASSNVAAPAELSWQELSLPIDINFEFDEKSQKKVVVSNLIKHAELKGKLNSSSKYQFVDDNQVNFIIELNIDKVFSKEELKKRLEQYLPSEK